MSTGCRIRNVRLKNHDKNVRVLPTGFRSYLSDIVPHIGDQIKPSTKAVIFTIIDESGAVFTGCSYMGGFTAMELFGALELTKQDLFEKVFGHD